MRKIKVAFFDFDETVISFKSMFSFIEFFWKEKYHEQGEVLFNRYISEVKFQWENNVPRERINLDYYRKFKGESVDNIVALSAAWIAHEKRNYAENFYIKETQDAINTYKSLGVSVVLVSGAMRDTIMPLADEIGADEVLATRLEIVNGYFTGDIIPPQTIGIGKAQAINHFMQKNHIKRDETIAWGDHDSDFDMLDAAGKGVIISNNEEIITKARDKGYDVVIR